jgi:hypothetical protein
MPHASELDFSNADQDDLAGMSTALLIARLTEVQHLLLELVRKLDDDRARYPFELKQA